MRGTFLAIGLACLILVAGCQASAAERTFLAAEGIRCPWPATLYPLGRAREDQVIERLVAARDRLPKTEEGLAEVERAFASVARSYSSNNEKLYAEHFSEGMLVRAYQELGMPAKAVEHLSLEISSLNKPNNPWGDRTNGLYLARARLLEDLGRNDEALSDLQKAQALGCAGPALDARIAQISARVSAQAAAAARVNEQIEEVQRRGAEAEQNQDFRGALATYVKGIEAALPGPAPAALVTKAVGAAAKLSPPPPIPEGARKHAVFAQTAFKKAKTKDDFEVARAEYRQALALAPWWADAWVTLSAVDEKLGDFAAAATDLETYLRAAPRASDRDEVQNKIYELQFMAKQKGRVGFGN